MYYLTNEDLILSTNNVSYDLILTIYIDLTNHYIYFNDRLSIYRLLDESSDLFLNLINFKKRFPLHKYPFMDATEGMTFRVAMDEMNADFQSRNFAPSVIPVLLVISIFYDGAQLYKSKVSDFSPLLMTIINLPPTYRKLGTGSFFILFSTSSSKSTTENFLFHDCLVKELENLAKGKKLQINGKEYVLMVQCKLSIMDTKQLETSLRITGTNSLYGCNLCGFHGVSEKKILNKVVYETHRQFLDNRNICRGRGASGKCCPPDYYLKEADFLKNDKVSVKRTLNYAQKRSEDDHRTNREFDRQNFKTICFQNEDLTSFFNYRNEDTFTYKSTDVDGCRVNFDEIFGNNIHYAHCCYLERKEYSRFTHEYYYNNTKQFDTMNKANSKVVVHKGIKGFWFMLNLKYCNIVTDVEYDPFHVIFNNGKYLIFLLKGERGNTTASRQYAIETDTFYPEMHKEDLSPSWLISLDNQTYFDAVINNILIPTGYKGDFGVKNVFQQTGKMRYSMFTDFTLLLK